MNYRFSLNTVYYLCLIILTGCTSSDSDIGIELRPYETVDISVEEWRMYRNMVADKLKSGYEEVKLGDLEEYVYGQRGVAILFTLPAHKGLHVIG